MDYQIKIMGKTTLSNNIGIIKLAIALILYSCNAVKKDSSYYVKQGLIEDSLSNIEEAINNYTKAIELDSLNIEAYYYRGSKLQLLGSKEQPSFFDKAILDINNCIRLDSLNGKYYFKRGVIKYNSGDLAEACKDWIIGEKLGDNNCTNNISKRCR